MSSTCYTTAIFLAANGDISPYDRISEEQLPKYGRVYNSGISSINQLHLTALSVLMRKIVDNINSKSSVLT